MKPRLRLGMVFAAALVGLALVQAALAFQPSLAVVRGVNLQSQQTTTDVSYTQTNSDAAAAKVQILSPLGYTVTLNQSPGTQIGTVDGSVIAGELGGVTVPITGTIVVGDPTSAPLQATAESCTGAKVHDAIWLLNVSAGGQSLPNPVPVFVDHVTTEPFSAFASASLQLCLPPPPAAAFQIKLLQATLHLVNVFEPPAAAGDYRWTGINTPYGEDNHVDPFNTTETQAIETTPVNATLASKVIRKTRKVRHKNFTDFFYTYSARISGQVQAGGTGAGGVPVDIFVGDAKVASTTTDDNGLYSATFKLTKTTTYHAVATKTPAAQSNGNCVPPLPSNQLGLDLPCGPVFGNGFVVTTTDKRVVKPKLSHKRVKHKKKKHKKHRH